MFKKNVTVKIDDEIWEQAKIELAKIGMSRSAFIEIIFEGMVSTKKKSIKEVWKNMASSIIDKVKLKE